LWLRSWLPRPSSSRSRGLFCKSFWCLTMMASIAFIAIGGHLNCVHRGWGWCRCLFLLLAAMCSCDDVTSAATFLTSLYTKGGNHHSMIHSFYFIALQAKDQLI
jgi:hypothetical protein